MVGFFTGCGDYPTPLYRLTSAAVRGHIPQAAPPPTEVRFMSSTPETATQVASPSVFLLSVTDRAVAKVKEFAAKMPEAASKPLRVFIQGGGCSGFQYGFTFDDKRPTDHVLAVKDIEVVVDPASALKLHGATVDFVEDMRGAGFAVENPNATGGSCGCGKSFS